jgi:hypothetical protein
MKVKHGKLWRWAHESNRKTGSRGWTWIWKVGRLAKTGMDRFLRILLLVISLFYIPGYRSQVFLLLFLLVASCWKVLCWSESWAC